MLLDAAVARQYGGGAETMILAAQALDGGRNQPETERPCVDGGAQRGLNYRPAHARATASGHSPRASPMALGFSVSGSRSLMACVHSGASRRASSRTRPKSGLILPVMPIWGVTSNTSQSP